MQSTMDGHHRYEITYSHVCVCPHVCIIVYKCFYVTIMSAKRRLLAFPHLTFTYNQFTKMVPDLMDFHGNVNGGVDFKQPSRVNITSTY